MSEEISDIPNNSVVSCIREHSAPVRAPQETVEHWPERNKGIFTFTREELRKKREASQKNIDSKFIEEMIGVMKILVLDANEKGKTSYTYNYCIDDMEKKVLLSEIQKRLTNMFMDSVVTIWNHNQYVKINIDWNEDKIDLK